jgi:hypothetical protein
MVRARVRSRRPGQPPLIAAGSRVMIQIRMFCSTAGRKACHQGLVLVGGRRSHAVPAWKRPPSLPGLRGSCERTEEPVAGVLRQG